MNDRMMLFERSGKVHKTNLMHPAEVNIYLFIFLSPLVIPTHFTHFIHVLRSDDTTKSRQYTENLDIFPTDDHSWQTKSHWHFGTNRLTLPFIYLVIIFL